MAFDRVGLEDKDARCHSSDDGDVGFGPIAKILANLLEVSGLAPLRPPLYCADLYDFFVPGGAGKTSRPIAAYSSAAAPRALKGCTSGSMTALVFVRSILKEIL